MFQINFGFFSCSIIECMIKCRRWFKMFNYIKGIVTFAEANYIVLECNSIGYQIVVSNLFSFPLNTQVFVYIYTHLSE